MPAFADNHVLCTLLLAPFLMGRTRACIFSFRLATDAPARAVEGQGPLRFHASHVLAAERQRDATSTLWVRVASSVAVFHVTAAAAPCPSRRPLSPLRAPQLRPGARAVLVGPGGHLCRACW